MSRIHYYSRRRGDREEVFYVERLWQLAADLPVREVPIDSLDLDKAVWFHDRCPPLTEVVAHFEKVLEADLDYPIILCAAGKVMDGYHRLVKAKLQGQSHVAVVQFEVDPEPDKVRSAGEERARRAARKEEQARLARLNDRDGALNDRRRRLAAELGAETERMRDAVAERLSNEEAADVARVLRAATLELRRELDEAIVAVASAAENHTELARIALATLARVRDNYADDERFAFLRQARTELDVDPRYESIWCSALDDLQALLEPLAAEPPRH